MIACGLFIACQGNSKKLKKLTIKLTDKTLTLPLDNRTSNISDGIFYLKSENILFNLNWNENGVQLYDVGKKTKIKSLNFDYEGPNGVLDLMGIYVQSLDSIFLFNQLESQITLIDSSGKIQSKIPYQLPEKYSPAFVHNAYFHSTPLLIDEKLIVKTHYYGPYSEMTQEILQSKELLYEIDLQTGKTEFLDFKFPIDYMKDGLKLFEASIAHGAGKHVFSLFGDHRLFYVSEFGEPLKMVEGKSEFLPQKLPLFPIDADPVEYRNYSFYSPHYESLDYDPFRNVFIRFAFHPFEQKVDIPPSEMRNFSGPFSIQVFDENLTFLSETAFEANHFHPFIYFITKEGIYISTNHPLNPNSQEDEMSFALLEYK